MQPSTINNLVTDDINWLPGTKSLFITGNVTEVWQINTSLFQVHLDGFYSLLDKNEIGKSLKFHFQKDRASYVISHGALRMLLGKFLRKPPASLIFKTGINGKPLLENAPDVHFNISHSGECTLIAIAGSDVGADVEKINYDFDFHSVLQGNFSVAEQAYILAGKHETFFKFWTRKEALAKFTGQGLNDDLKLLPANDGLNVATTLINASGDLLVYSFKINSGYYCSVAGYADTAQLSYYDFTYPLYQSLVADVFPR